MMVKDNGLSADMSVRDMMELDEDFNVDSEEEALAYLDFLEKKMDELNVSNNMVAQSLANDYEKRMDATPRAVRRMFQKQSFSDRFKANINGKKVNN